MCCKHSVAGMTKCIRQQWQSGFFIYSFNDVIVLRFMHVVSCATSGEKKFYQYAFGMRIVFSGVWNFIQDSFTNISVQLNWLC